MNGKVASIALVLIVAIPLLLGYCLNLTEEEITGWESTDSVNMTDTMLNSSSPVFVTSYAPHNNSEIYARITYPGAGVTEYGVYSPAFSSTGSVYTSIPAYRTVSATYTLNTPTVTTTEGTDMGTYSEVTFSNPHHTPYLYIQASELSQLNYAGASDLGTYWQFVARNGVQYISTDNTDGSLAEGTYSSSVIVLSDRYPTYRYVTNTYTQLEIATDYAFTQVSPAVFKIEDSGGRVYYNSITNSDGVSVSKTGDTLIIGSSVYTGVSAVYIASSSSTIYYTYTEQIADTYANPSYGWTTNISSGNVVQPYWQNGQTNQSVRMMMSISTGEYLDLQVVNGSDSSDTVSIRNTAGVITVNGTELGTYTYLCADITGKGLTLSGLNAWPDMFAAPNVINSVSVDFANALDTFMRIYLSGSNTIEYRVDSAVIQSGTFATTTDYTLDMGALWPGKSFSVTIPNIGIYGDTVTFGGQSYAVTDGAITVNGQTVRLLKCAFSSTYNEDRGEWTNAINGYTVSADTVPSSVYFGGEWSFIVTAYAMEETTSTELVWHAGEFAFNGFDSNFALLGLVSCVGVFIALGIYGQRSGAKVGTLLLICGCAGLLFLAMI